MALAQKTKRLLTLIRRPLRRFGRMRRSRGFGVHSPFAFRFIRFTLRNTSAYYSYASIDRLAVSSRRKRELKSLFRVICDLAPSRIVTTGAISEAERSVIRMADSRLPLQPAATAAIAHRTMLYVSAASAVSPEELVGMANRVFESEGVLYVRDSAGAPLDRLRRILRNGMTFSNGRTVIMVSRHDLPRQDFDLGF